MGTHLEVPRLRASNEYHNVCFCGKIRKQCQYFLIEKRPEKIQRLYLKFVFKAISKGENFYRQKLSCLQSIWNHSKNGGYS